MILAILHTLAHHSPIPPDRPGAFLTALNERLTARYTATTGTFVTAFFAVVDPAAGSMTYASAGHVPPRLVRADGRDGVALNRAQRLPLGINPKAASYPEASVTFAPGDTVAIVTDGITEATDHRGDCFGLERIDAALVLAAGNAGHRLAAVRIALDAFSGADSPKDDQTVVVIRRP
jgi:sigma-B regulation protein RsbU (phosphoserine phosphatase)